jgi:hypothetical protein
VSVRLWYCLKVGDDEGVAVREPVLVCLRMVVQERLKGSVLEARGLARMRLAAMVVSPQSG